MNCDEFTKKRPTPINREQALNAQDPMSKSEAEKFAGRAGKQLRLFFGRKFHRFNELTRVRFAQRERIIGAKCDAFRAEKFYQHPQGVGVVNE